MVITALGSTVRVQTEGKDLSLQSGQQVDITQEGTLKVTPADTAAITSWKEEIK